MACLTLPGCDGLFGMRSRAAAFFHAHNNPGFDVLSKTPRGRSPDRDQIHRRAVDRLRRLDVRDPVEENQTASDDFWLYVVEHAEDDDAVRHPPDPEPGG